MLPINALASLPVPASASTGNDTADAASLTESEGPAGTSDGVAGDSPIGDGTPFSGLLLDLLGIAVPPTGALPPAGPPETMDLVQTGNPLPGPATVALPEAVIAQVGAAVGASAGGQARAMAAAGVGADAPAGALSGAVGAAQGERALGPLASPVAVSGVEPGGNETAFAAAIGSPGSQEPTPGLAIFGSELLDPSLDSGGDAMAPVPTSTAGQAPSGRPLAVDVPVPVQDPRWTPSFAERVSWLVTGEVKQADLRLNPPELGPVEVHIALAEAEARISFTAQHASVREAVEAAVPRLREMLAAAGVNLVHVDVSGRGSEGQQPFAHRSPEHGATTAGQGRGGGTGSVQGTSAAARHVGLFDAYA